MAGLGSALYGLFSRATLNRGYNPLTVNLYSFVFTCLVALPFTQFDVIKESLDQAPVLISVMSLLHAIFVCLLPYVCFTIGLSYVDTGKASILVSIEPVAATIFGIILYREIPNFIEVIGILLILFALILLNLPKGFKSFAPNKRANN